MSWFIVFAVLFGCLEIACQESDALIEDALKKIEETLGDQVSL